MRPAEAPKMNPIYHAQIAEMATVSEKPWLGSELKGSG